MMEHQDIQHQNILALQSKLQPRLAVMTSYKKELIDSCTESDVVITKVRHIAYHFRLQISYFDVIHLIFLREPNHSVYNLLDMN